MSLPRAKLMAKKKSQFTCRRFSHFMPFTYAAIPGLLEFLPLEFMIVFSPRRQIHPIVHLSFHICMGIVCAIASRKSEPKRITILSGLLDTEEGKHPIRPEIPRKTHEELFPRERSLHVLSVCDGFLATTVFYIRSQMVKKFSPHKAAIPSPLTHPSQLTRYFKSEF